MRAVVADQRNVILVFVKPSNTRSVAAASRLGRSTLASRNTHRLMHERPDCAAAGKATNIAVNP